MTAAGESAVTGVSVPRSTHASQPLRGHHGRAQRHREETDLDDRSSGGAGDRQGLARLGSGLGPRSGSGPVRAVAACGHADFSGRALSDPAMSLPSIGATNTAAVPVPASVRQPGGTRTGMETVASATSASAITASSTTAADAALASSVFADSVMSIWSSMRQMSVVSPEQSAPSAGPASSNIHGRLRMNSAPGATIGPLFDTVTDKMPLSVMSNGRTMLTSRSVSSTETGSLVFPSGSVRTRNRRRRRGRCRPRCRWVRPL